MLGRASNGCRASQHVRGDMHSAPGQILERAVARIRFETPGESCPRQTGQGRQLIHRPAMRRCLLHPGYHLVHIRVVPLTEQTKTVCRAIGTVTDDQ